MIRLRDALRLMTPTEPFTITLIKCNLREDTGGQRVTYENAVLAGAPFGKKGAAKDANHYLNGTRNLMVPGRSRPLTIHNVLITALNGERVYI